MSGIRFRNETGQIKFGTFDGEQIHYGGTSYNFTDVDILPPSDPTKVILVGRNMQDAIDEKGIDIPDSPRLFTVPPSAVIGHQDTVLPPEETNPTYGSELGVVIGKQCVRVSEADAWDVISGLTCINDISNNELIPIDPSKARVKGFDGAKPIGPVLASPEDVPNDAAIRLKVNGEIVQASSRDNYIYKIPEIIEAVTKYFTLEPGDVISMGSPAGSPRLTDGDTVEVEIEGIGTLTHYTAQRN